MTDRMDPGETQEIWKGLSALLQKGRLRPAVFNREYSGLESVVDALGDLSRREVWGKAVIRIGIKEQKPRL